MAIADKNEPNGTFARLISDLEVATKKADFGAGCQVCLSLEQCSDESVRVAIRAALASTLGEVPLAAILTRNGYPVGRRAINRHRKEGHA